MALTLQQTIEPLMDTPAERAANPHTWTAAQRHISNLRGGRSEVHAAALRFVLDQQAKICTPGQTIGMYKKIEPTKTIKQ